MALDWGGYTSYYTACGSYAKAATAMSAKSPPFTLSMPHSTTPQTPTIDNVKPTLLLCDWLID
jgi:hypothetical protein